MPSSVPSARLPRTVFCLHFLGGSAREWVWVARGLGASFELVGIDLPGFGDAALVPGHSVEGMADHVSRLIQARAPRRYILVGHSMGAKVAAVLARRAEDGSRGLAGLEGIAMLAGSPPSPEPMQEEKRQRMLGLFEGPTDARRTQAGTYIDANVGGPLDREMRTRAVDDVLRTNPVAWRDWLEGGSREDWSRYVGVLRTPALILSGSKDGELGPSAQERLMAPHFASARSIALEGAGHLLPMERADEVARRIEGFCSGPARSARRGPIVANAYAALIRSDRVNARLRDALLARAEPDDPAYRPAVLGADELAILRALIDRVLPQDPAGRIDLGARIDRMLGEGVGDGWRHADMPSDAEAYRRALRTLDVVARQTLDRTFVSLDEGQQRGFLESVAGGRLPVGPEAGAGSDLLTADQMRLWFDDLRSDAVRIFVAHPATLAGMGFGGIGAGGDAGRLTGFDRLGIGQREPWELPATKVVAS